MNQMIAVVNPTPKPRMTQRDVWAKRPCVLRYRSFCDQLRNHAEEQGFTLPERFAIRFWVPMPKSWSEARKHQMLHEPHQQKPDLSNLLKAVEDALLDEDERIYEVHATKRWAAVGAVEIEELIKETE